MIIGVDIDEVLAELNNKLLEFHNEKYDTSLEKKDLTAYFLEEVIDISKEEAQKRIFEFYESTHFEEIPTVLQSIDAIEKLVKKNILIAITSRHVHMKDRTKTWLEKHFKNHINEVHFSSKDTKTKAQICLENNVEVFIEDNLLYATEVAEAGIKVFLVDNPWNQSDDLHENICRVCGWDEILEHLKNEI